MEIELSHIKFKCVSCCCFEFVLQVCFQAEGLRVLIRSAFAPAKPCQGIAHGCHRRTRRTMQNGGRQASRSVHQEARTSLAGRRPKKGGSPVARSSASWPNGGKRDDHSSRAVVACTGRALRHSITKIDGKRAEQTLLLQRVPARKHKSLCSSRTLHAVQLWPCMAAPLHRASLPVSPARAIRAR